MTTPSSPPTPGAGCIELRDSVDGKIALQPIKYAEQCKAHVKEEPAAKTEQNAAEQGESLTLSLPGEQNAAAQGEPIPASTPGSSAALVLDPLAIAAVNALRARNNVKKLDARVLRKRPACASGSADGLDTKPELAVKKIKTEKKNYWD